MTVNSTPTDDRSTQDSAPPARPIALVIAHRSQVFADGLAALLGTDPDTFRILASATDLPAADETPAADVLLLDPGLVEDPAVLDALATDWEGSRVLLLADADEPEHNIRLLAAGATGLVDRRVGAEAVAAAVRATAHGMAVAPSHYIRLAADRLAAAFDDWFEDLSDEEVDLWRDVAAGADYGAIAERRFISERTARRHVDALLERLGVDNRFAAAELAGRVFLRDHPTRAADEVNGAPKAT